MGLYLEYRAPPHMTKLDWLEANGTEVAGITAHSPNVVDEAVLVAFTLNPFEAAALMFEQREMKRFVVGRPGEVRWFRVPLPALSEKERSYISPVRR
jgi:hypothetical protein